MIKEIAPGQVKFQIQDLFVIDLNYISEIIKKYVFHISHSEDKNLKAINKKHKFILPY